MQEGTRHQSAQTPIRQWAAAVPLVQRIIVSRCQACSPSAATAAPLHSQVDRRRQLQRAAAVKGADGQLAKQDRTIDRAQVQSYNSKSGSIQQSRATTRLRASLPAPPLTLATQMRHPNRSFASVLAAAVWPQQQQGICS
jgi:hypothetical protein